MYSLVKGSLLEHVLWDSDIYDIVKKLIFLQTSLYYIMIMGL